MAEIAAVQYRAFLSYSHRDKAWAKWLHAALEGYRIDKDLVGRATPAGPVPKTLRPIFRDREDFSAGHSLTAQTLAALEASQFLIVLCSPNAAKSKYVDEEIRRFKAMGRAERVIPVVVDGEPGDPERECFPDALRLDVDADGAPTGEGVEPLAADARPQGDGKVLARQKVVAALLGLRLDEIIRRAERSRRRRNSVWGSLAGVFLMLAVAAGGSAVYAWQQIKTNEAFLNATLKRATEIVNGAIVQAEKYNVPRTATLDLLARAEGLFDDMAQYGRPTPELRYLKAWMLIQFARNYAILGDTNKQQARAIGAHRLLAELAAEQPDDLIRQRDRSLALDEIGDVLRNLGNLDEALGSYRSSLAVYERLAGSAPDNVLWQRDVGRSHARIGDVLREQGKSDEALASYRVGLVVQERLAAADPGNAVLLNDLAASHNDVGNVLWDQGSHEQALASYRASLAINERLAGADPTSADRQRELLVSQQKVANVLQIQGNLDEALATFRATLAIAERLATADRNNALWQRDLLVMYSRLGDLLDRQDNTDEALANYRAGLVIAERLAAADPSNAGRQSDLSVSYGKVGTALRRQGNFDEALESYRTSLAIAEQVAAADRSNARWQRDVAFSHSNIALVHRGQSRSAEALAEFRKGREILAALSLEQAKNDLAWFDQQIATLESQARPTLQGPGALWGLPSGMIWSRP